MYGSQQLHSHLYTHMCYLTLLLCTFSGCEWYSAFDQRLYEDGTDDFRDPLERPVCYFHAIYHLLLIHICKLHWNLLGRTTRIKTPSCSACRCLSHRRNNNRRSCPVTIYRCQAATYILCKERGLWRQVSTADTYNKHFILRTKHHRCSTLLLLIVLNRGKKTW